MRLYHVTPVDNVSSILKYGLKPEVGGTFKDPGVGSDEARVYLTEDLEDVLSHALKYVGDWAVLEVYVPSRGVRLYPDPGSLEAEHYYITRRVPPQNIRVIRTYHSE